MENIAVAWEMWLLRKTLLLHGENVSFLGCIINLCKVVENIAVACEKWLLLLLHGEYSSCTEKWLLYRKNSCCTEKWLLHGKMADAIENTAAWKYDCYLENIAIA